MSNSIMERLSSLEVVKIASYIDPQSESVERTCYLHDPTGSLLTRDVEVSVSEPNPRHLTDHLQYSIVMRLGPYIEVLNGLLDDAEDVDKVMYVKSLGFNNVEGARVFLTPNAAISKSGKCTGVAYSSSGKPNHQATSVAKQNGTLIPSVNGKHAKKAATKYVERASEAYGDFFPVALTLTFAGLSNAITPLNLVTHVFGPTGSYKSTLERQINAVLGVFDEAKDTAHVQFENWDMLTFPRIQQLASIGAGCTLVLDDYLPEHSKNLDTVIRGFADRKNRGTHSASAITYGPVTASLRSNGESLFVGCKHSLQARVFAIPMPSLDEALLGLLTPKFVCYANTFAANLIQKLLTDWDAYSVEWPMEIKVIAKSLHAELPEGSHSRLSQNCARLIHLSEFLFDYLHKVGAIAEPKRLKRYKADARSRFIKLGVQQREFWSASTASGQVMAKIKSDLRSGKFYLTTKGKQNEKAGIYTIANAPKKMSWAGEIDEDSGTVSLVPEFLLPSRFSGFETMKSRSFRQMLFDDDVLIRGKKGRYVSAKSFKYLDKVNYPGRRNGNQIGVIELQFKI